MIANAETCIKALRALAQDIQSEDGVANAALSECADRMELLIEAGDELSKQVNLFYAKQWEDAKGEK
jgi:hypothetical protein